MGILSNTYEGLRPLQALKALQAQVTRGTRAIREIRAMVEAVEAGALEVIGEERELAKEVSKAGQRLAVQEIKVTRVTKVMMLMTQNR